MPTTDLQLIPTLPADYAGLTEGAVWHGFYVPPGGLEPNGTLQMLAGLSDRLKIAQGWGTWVGVCAGEVVVSVAVKAPLADGCVEIGYGVAPQRRGRGHATAAVLAVLTELRKWEVLTVTAQSAVANPASARVLTKAGFVVTGTRHDVKVGMLDQWVLGL